LEIEMSRASWMQLLVVVPCLLAAGCSGKEDSGNGDLEQDPSLEAGEDGGMKDAGKDAGRDASRGDARADSTTPPKANPVDPAAGTCAAITQEAPPLRGKVDVLWVVDNSPSMFDKILQVQANIANFFNQIEMSGADVHIVSISLGNLAIGTPLESDAEKHKYVPSNVWSKLLFSATLDSFPLYMDFLRPDATTHVVLVSDDDDIIASADFISQMEAKLGHPFAVHAIVAQEFGCGSAVGTQYMNAAMETSGEQISVCSQDWTQVFGKLTNAVVASVPLPCSYDIASAAMSADKYDPTQVQVNYTPASSDAKQELPKSSSASACADKAGWYYDNEAAPTTVELCPAACELVKAGGGMSIAFGCQPTVFL
jgi:hypothetical protein